MTTDKAQLEAALAEYERRHQFAREVLPPVEDQLRLGLPRSGGYRWFRSQNVVDLDKIRRLKSQPQPRELTHDPQGRTHA